MNERERWVVYPLLFLALGASLRDKLAGRTATGSIVCEELIIMDEAPFGRQSDRPLVRIGRSERSAKNPAIGRVEVAGSISATAIHAAAINAKQYAHDGIPFAPSVQASDLWRAFEQMASEWQRARDADEQTGANQAAQAAKETPGEQAPEAASGSPAAQAAGAE